MPTRKVVAGFGPISADNRRVILQEWLAEAFTMWGIAATVIAAFGLAWLAVRTGTPRSRLVPAAVSDP
jgi:hypothetical protein